MLNVNDTPTDSDIKKWSEGNEHLEKLLIACRENGIPSMFCCSGHEKDSTAYITLKMNDQTIKKVYSIINYLNNTKNVSLVFSRNAMFEDSKFSVYMHDENEKNSIMDIISRAISQEENFENLSINSQILLEIAELLISNKFNFDLTYYKGREKGICFRNILLESTNYPFDKKMEQMGFFYKRNGLVTRYLIKGINDINEQKILEKILKGMENICAEFGGNRSSEYQERILFERILSKDGQLKGKSNLSACESNNKGMKEIIERD